MHQDDRDNATLRKEEYLSITDILPPDDSWFMRCFRLPKLFKKTAKIPQLICPSVSASCLFMSQDTGYASICSTQFLVLMFVLASAFRCDHLIFSPLTLELMPL